MVLDFLRNKKAQLCTTTCGLCCITFGPPTLIAVAIMYAVGYGTMEILSILAAFYGIMAIGFLAFVGVVGPFIGPVFKSIMDMVLSPLEMVLSIVPVLGGQIGNQLKSGMASGEKMLDKMGNFLRKGVLFIILLMVLITVLPTPGATLTKMILVILGLVFSLGGITKKLPDGVCVILVSLLFAVGTFIMHPFAAVFGTIVLIIIVVIVVAAIIAGIIAISVLTCGAADAGIAAALGVGGEAAGAGALAVGETAAVAGEATAIAGETAAVAGEGVGLGLEGGVEGAEVMMEGAEGVGEAAEATEGMAGEGEGALNEMSEGAEGAEEDEFETRARDEMEDRMKDKAQAQQKQITQQRDNARERVEAVRERQRGGGILDRSGTHSIGSLIFLVLLVIIVLPLILGMLCLFNTFGASCLYIEDYFGIWDGKFWQGLLWPLKILWENILNLLFSLKSKLIPQTVMGVPVSGALKYETCYPFCISDSGQDEKWHGLEIQTFSLVPPTVMDYQQWSIKLEFVNEGAYEARFKVPLLPEFGCVQTCEWDFDKGIWEFIGDCTETSKEGSIIDPCIAKCQEVCPLELTKEVPFVAGGCIDEIADKNKNYQIIPGSDGFSRNYCELPPSDSLAIYWHGNTIKSESQIEVGDVFKPDVTLDITYSYRPPNDLIGELPVFGIKTQLAATETKSIGRIANKVSASYSPVGPLMMAMGSAEDQVIAGVPTLFMIQFTNKGRGVIQPINKGQLMLYVPKEFKVMDDAQCDFKRIGTGESYKNNADVYPGPGFDDYIVYQAKQDLPELVHSSNPINNPVLACIFIPPSGDDLKSYTFKARVLEYRVEETKTMQLKIIGTAVKEVAPEGAGLTS